MQTMYSSDLRQLVETTTVSFFESMLHMAVWPVDAETPELDQLFCTARVSMLCDPSIDVYFHLKASQACALSERLMQIPQPDQLDEDVRDTMREIVNVIGGNLKASLAEGKQLTIAEVLEDGCIPVADGSREVFAFESNLGVFWISLQSSADQAQGFVPEEALIAS